MNLSAKTLLLILTASMTIYTWYKVSPVQIDASINMQLSKSKEPIFDLNHLDLSKIEPALSLSIDQIRFKAGPPLWHYKLGNLAYRDNFYLDFNSEMELLVGGKYEFGVYSDDGFKLLINDREICSHIKDRPAALTRCFTELAVGQHTLKLTYFQGGGQQALWAKYRLSGEKAGYFIGEDSKWARFRMPKG